MVKAWLYDWMYRRGAPWEIGARSELVDLVTSGRLDPSTHPRAVDLGCGTGANTVFLAERGFDVVGVDFSPVALAKARDKARDAGVSDRCRFVQGDLTAADPPVPGPYDLLVDYGTLDDLKGEKRRAMARQVRSLARPGSQFLLWCFHGPKRELPWISFSGPSRMAPGLEPGEEVALFGDAFTIERLPEPTPDTHCACFVLTRR